MRECGKKACLANVNGQCSVQECKGPIVRMHSAPEKDIAQAAKFYEASKKAFERWFQEAPPYDQD